MVLGGATQKLQTTIELAEDLYEKVTKLRQEVQDTQETVRDSNDRIEALEAEVTYQRELLQDLAEAQGVEVAEFEPPTSDDDGGEDESA